MSPAFNGRVPTGDGLAAWQLEPGHQVLVPLPDEQLGGRVTRWAVLTVTHVKAWDHPMTGPAWEVTAAERGQEPRQLVLHEGDRVLVLDP